MVTLLRLQSLWSLNHAVKWGRVLNINADFRFLRLKSSERLQSGQFNLFLAAVGRPLVLWKFFWAVCLILISFELLFSRRKLVIVLYILNSKQYKEFLSLCFILICFGLQCKNISRDMK